MRRTVTALIALGLLTVLSGQHSPDASTNIDKVRLFHPRCDPKTTDADCDGIPDTTEDALLRRFRPYFLFSHDGHDENYAPADARLYIQRSELRDSGDEDGGKTTIAQALLAANPDGILFTASQPKFSPDVTASTEDLPSFYHINPIEHVPGLSKDNPGRHGNDWAEVLVNRHVGLYGHVVPFMAPGPYARDGIDAYGVCPNGTTALPTPPPRQLYKIEYWQFFGYNEAEHAYIGNHEGDWTSVQVIYDPQSDVATSVSHFAHGLQFRFDITPEANASATPLAGPDGPMLQYVSCNYHKYGGKIDLARLDIGVLPWAIAINDDQLYHAQQNVLRMFKLPTERRFEHPVVYIENGTHEFYPTEAWSFYGAPNHNGKAQHYLTETPPNLGEVDFPLSETSSAQTILRFNGRWGTFSRINSPAQGPALHDNWKPVAGSALEKIHQAKHFGN